LVEARVPESRSLDYKAELYEPSPKGFREFASDLAAFANTDGGFWCSAFPSGDWKAPRLPNPRPSSD
jgi:hypothetical protein